MVARFQLILSFIVFVALASAELLPTLQLKPNGYVYFTNKTKTRTPQNEFNFYLKLNDEPEEKRQIMMISSEVRTEQYIRVSTLDMKLSVLVNLCHPPMAKWIVCDTKLTSNKVYFVRIAQNGTEIEITLNNVTETHSVDNVEAFVYPAKISLGFAQTLKGINGSVAGLEFNGVRVLHSYVKRDDDFRDVKVTLGGEVIVKQLEWETIYERDKIFCPHNNLFPKSEVGREIKLNCQQGIARAVCGSNKIWLVERCNKDSETPNKITAPEDRINRDDKHGGGGFSTDSLLIYIGIGAAGIIIITVAIIIVIVRRNKRNKIHRYKMANNQEHPFRGDSYITRLNGISTLPLKLDGSTSGSANGAHIPMRRSLEMSCSTLDNPSSDILDNRIPVFTTTANPLSKHEDLYPVYMTSDGNMEQPRNQDIISTILGERPERNYTNHSLIPGSLLTSTTGLNSDAGSSSNHPWNDV